VVGSAHAPSSDISPLIPARGPAAALGSSSRRASVGSPAERVARSPARFPRLARARRGLDAGRHATARRAGGAAIRPHGALAPPVVARGRAAGDGGNLPVGGGCLVPLDVARGAPPLWSSHRNCLRHGAGRAGGRCSARRRTDAVAVGSLSVDGRPRRTSVARGIGAHRIGVESGVRRSGGGGARAGGAGARGPAVTAAGAFFARGSGRARPRGTTHRHPLVRRGRLVHAHGRGACVVRRAPSRGPRRDGGAARRCFRRGDAERDRRARGRRTDSSAPGWDSPPPRRIRRVCGGLRRLHPHLLLTRLRGAPCIHLRACSSAASCGERAGLRGAARPLDAG